MLEIAIALVVGVVCGRALDLYGNRQSSEAEGDEEISVTEGEDTSE
jgi:hypothetical protein